MLESVPARKRRLSAQQDTTGGRKRGNTGHTRAVKSSGSPKTQLRDGDTCNKTKKMSPAAKEKENKTMRKNDNAPAMSDGRSIVVPQDTVKQELKDEIFVGETKPKRKLENGREGKVRAKKVKAAANPHIPEGDVNDNNNNNSDVKPVVGVSMLISVLVSLLWEGIACAGSIVSWVLHDLSVIKKHRWLKCPVVLIWLRNTNITLGM